MNKENTIKSIQDVRKHHEIQMQKLEMLVNGKNVTGITPALKSECNFGKWFYSHDNHIEEIIGLQFYENLEKLHSAWHRQYIIIYNAIFSDKQKGFFSKLLGSSKVDTLKLDKAKVYLSELKGTSEKLLQALDASNRRITALSDTKFY